MKDINQSRDVPVSMYTEKWSCISLQRQIYILGKKTMKNFAVEKFTYWLSYQACQGLYNTYICKCKSFNKINNVKYFIK